MVASAATVNNTVKFNVVDSTVDTLFKYHEKLGRILQHGGTFGSLGSDQSDDYAGSFRKGPSPGQGSQSPETYMGQKSRDPCHPPT